MTWSGRADVADRFLRGQGYAMPFVSLGAGATTAGAVAGGTLEWGLTPNAIGSTLPGTLVPIRTPTGMRFLGAVQAALTASQYGGFLAWLYEVGTVNLAATGDQFTHHAATFPLLRTVFGATNQPVSLIPVLHITTAITTTNPVIQYRTAAGGSGYVDQDGNATVGTRSITVPLAVTNSCYLPPIEIGDAAVRDITAIQVTTAGATGAARLYLAEPITPVGAFVPGGVTVNDAITGGMHPQRTTPAVATSGTANALVTILANSASSRIYGGLMMGVTP